MNREDTLLAIAQNNFGFSRLKARNIDRHDFRNVSVWDVKNALERAYEAGAHMGNKTYTLVIEANQPACKFDKTMTSYVTGCNASQEMEELYFMETRREPFPLAHRNVGSNQYDCSGPMSLELYLTEKPSNDTIEFLKKRARDFAAMLNDSSYNFSSLRHIPRPFRILGFRLISETTVVQVEERNV